MRVCVAVLLLGACAGAAPTSTEVAVALPALTLPLVGGGTWTSASARGSVLVIDVWATWCKPCSKGFPKLDALAARRSDVAVVGITIDEDATAIRDFLAQFPLAVPVAHDVDQLLTRPPLNVARLPTVLIVDADGMIRRRIEQPGEREYDQLESLASSVQR